MVTRPKTARPGGKARAAAPDAARPYHHGNLRASLLEAAEALLAERGAQGLTLRDVARAAGVSHAAPYHHFGSLNALLAAVAQRGFEALSAAMAEAVAVPDTRERLLRVTLAYVNFALAHPQCFRLMFGPMLASKAEHPELKRAAEAAFDHVLQAALAHDKRRGSDLAVAGWSLAHGLSHLLIDGAFEGMPLMQQRPELLARKLGERLLG
ncbi:MAG: TetR/AcrR family transcriptional regulator [Burkholderiales bacterium]|nr:TetR/AcrR family transcriptional regulator [Burkholderiales bacterium]